MKNLSGTSVYLALVHYPVVNKNGEIIASAVTNLDLHDMARAARTYAVKSFYVVTPLKDQQQLVGKIAEHWISGYGGECNPARRNALSLMRVTPSMQDVMADITAREGSRPQVVVTSAKTGPGRTGYRRMRTLINEGQSYVLTFGTAWGLAEAFVADADYILDPIQGGAEYNHLAVRSAASIILDRLLGDFDIRKSIK